MAVYQSFMVIYECISLGINWKGCHLGSKKAKAALQGFTGCYDVYQGCS
jgi:hypothetical protein